MLKSCMDDIKYLTPILQLIPERSFRNPTSYLLYGEHSSYTQTIDLVIKYLQHEG